MEFRVACIAGVSYAEEIDEAKRDAEQEEGRLATFQQLRDMLSGAGADPFADPGREREVAREFLSLLAVCHTVIPEVKDGKMVYQASSPDEAALVAGAEMLGYRFHVRSLQPLVFPVVLTLLQTRKPKSVFVSIEGETREFEILNVCEFCRTSPGTCGANSRTTRCTPLKGRWTCACPTAPRSRSRWVRIRCCCVGRSCATRPGATASLSTLATRRSSCGTPALRLPLLPLIHPHRNATAAPIKRTAVERQVNVQIVFLFVLLMALSLGSTIGSSIRAVGVRGSCSGQR